MTCEFTAGHPVAVARPEKNISGDELYGEAKAQSEGAGLIMWWGGLKPGFQLNATHATQPIAFSWKPKSAQETQ